LTNRYRGLHIGRVGGERQCNAKQQFIFSAHSGTLGQRPCQAAGYQPRICQHAHKGLCQMLARAPRRMMGQNISHKN
jgi:hypothetical protein